MKTKTIIALLLLSFIVCLNTSASKSDMPLLKQLEEMPSDQLLQKGLNYSRNSAYKDSAMLCYNIIANRYYTQRHTKEVVVQTVDALINIGYLYCFYYFDYENSYRYLQQALDISEKHEYRNGLPYIYINQASVLLTYYDLKEGQDPVNEVFALYESAFREACNIKNWDIMMSIMSNIAELKFNSPQLPPIDQIIGTFRSQDIPEQTPMYKYMLNICDAMEFFSAKDYENALPCFDEAMKNINAFDSPERYYIITIKNKANVYRLMRHYDEAIEEMKTAEDIARKYQTKDALVELYRLMAEIYKEKGDDKTAHDYKFMYYEKKDSLVSQSKLESVNSLRFTNKLQKMNEYVQQLNQKRKIHSIINISITIVACTIAVFMIVIVRKNKRLKENNHQLYLNNVEAMEKEKIERLRRMEYERMLQSQNDDTKKIKYQTSALKQDDKTEILKKIQEVMEDTALICSDDFTLNKLSELIESNYKYVSQVINEAYKQNFKQFVTTCRIREACRRFNSNEEFSNLTIEAIAESVGFKSRSSFIAAFKRIVGITPSEYIKKAKGI